MRSQVVKCPLQNQIGLRLSPWQTVQKLSTPDIPCWNGNYDEFAMTALDERIKQSTLSENGCTSPWVFDASNWTTNICKDPYSRNVATTETRAMMLNSKEYCKPACSSTFYFWEYEQIPVSIKTTQKRNYVIKFGCEYKMKIIGNIETGTSKILFI